MGRLKSLLRARLPAPHARCLPYSAGTFAPSFRLTVNGAHGQLSSRRSLRAACAVEESGIYCGRGTDAGDRNWGEHGDLQRSERNAPEAASFSRPWIAVPTDRTLADVSG